MADLLSQNGQAAAFRSQAEPDVVRVLLERFLQEVPSPSHRSVEICAHVRVTTEALLADLLGEAQAHELFTWLRGLSFIEQGPHGSFPHDLAREVLDRDLRWRNPESFRQLRRQVRRFIVRQLQESSGLDQQQAVYDWLYLQRYNSVAQGYLEMNSLVSSIYAEPATAHDYPLILEMVQRHEGELSVPIAQYWLQRQPQAFTVFRTADQQPSGFVAALVLQEVAPEDLEADPALKAAWAFVQSRGGLRPGEEITYKRFWMERERYQPAPSAALNLGA